MVENLIEKIQRMEKWARDNERKARQDARTIAEDAKAEGERRLERVRLEAKKNEEILFGGVIKSIDKKKEEIDAKNKEKLVALEKATGKTKEVAVQHIIHSFWNLREFLREHG